MRTKNNSFSTKANAIVYVYLQVDFVDVERNINI